PELLGVHLAEALVALELPALLAPLVDELPQRLGVLELGLRLVRLLLHPPREVGDRADRPDVLLDRVELLVLGGLDEAPVDRHGARRRARPRLDLDRRGAV